MTWIRSFIATLVADDQGYQFEIRLTNVLLLVFELQDKDRFCRFSPILLLFDLLLRRDLCSLKIHFMNLNLNSYCVIRQFIQKRV